MRCVGVYGASGFGREIMPIVRNCVNDGAADFFFVDDDPTKETHVLSFEDFISLPYEEKFVTIAIANSAVREVLALRCLKAGVRFLDVRSPNSIILDQVVLGEGSIICGFTHLTSNITIGRHFHANIYSYVAHDCIIGDFVTLAPGAKCNGNVHIEDHAYIGTGAVLKQGTPDKPLRIGRGAVVGMGAVVTKDVSPGVTVIGSPAKPMIARI